MNQAIEINVLDLIDQSIRDCVDSQIPPVPKYIADALASILCRGFSEKDYQDYRKQIESIAQERWTALMIKERRIDAELFRNRS